MQCYICGNSFDDGQSCCPVCGAAVQPAEPMQQNIPEASPEATQAVLPETPQPAAKPRKEPYQPHIALRVGMQILSFVLCMMLCSSLVATVVVADVNLLTSAGGIKQIITAVLLPAKAPAQSRILMAAADPGQVALPDGAADVLSGGDTSAIVDMLFSTIEGMMEDEEVPFTKQQLQTLVENSTVTDYIADKAAGYAEDILNGTENTEITSEELVQLVQDNKQIIEQTLEIEITEEQMAQIESNFITMVEENHINETIRTEINKAMDQIISESGNAGIPLTEIMEILRFLAQDSLLYTMLGICLALILLLCGANFYNVPAGMTWAAIPCIVIGGLLAAPVAILQLMPTILGDLAGFVSMVNVLTPIHYGIPLFGLVLLIASIAWRIIRSTIRNNQGVLL